MEQIENQIDNLEVWGFGVLQLEASKFETIGGTTLQLRFRSLSFVRLCFQKMRFSKSRCYRARIWMSRFWMLRFLRIEFGCLGIQPLLIEVLWNGLRLDLWMFSSSGGGRGNLES